LKVEAVLIIGSEEAPCLTNIYALQHTFMNLKDLDLIPQSTITTKETTDIRKEKSHISF